MLRKILAITFAIALIATGFVAIDNQGVNSPATSYAQSDSEVLLRLVHAVPGAGEVDIYINEDLVVAGVDFAEATPHFLAPAGEHTVAVRVAGDDPTSEAVAEDTVVLEASANNYRHYTAVVQADSEGALSFGLYTDDLTPKGLGGSRVHAINTVASLGAVDITLDTGQVLLSEVNFDAETGTIDPPVQAYNLVVVPSGSTPDSALFEIGDISLNTNLLYTFVIVEDPSEGLQAVTLVRPMLAEDGADVVFTAVAHGADAPAVDVYADESLILRDFQPGSITPHIPLPAGEVTLAFRAAGSPPNSEPAFEQTVAVESDTGAATLAAVGSLTDGTFNLALNADDISDLDPESARVNVLNTAATGPASVNIGAATLANGLGSFEFSETVDLSSGVYTLEAIVDDENGPVTASIEDLALVGGSYYTFLVSLDGDLTLATNGTNLTTGLLSLPGAQEGVAVAATTDTDPNAGTDSTDDGSTDGTSSDTASTDPTATPEPTEDPNEAPPPPTQAPTAAPAITPPPANNNIVIATVNLNTGVNLQCREYPSSQARSLGLVPNNTQLVVQGYAAPFDEDGQPLVPVIEEGSFEEDVTEFEEYEELWFRAEWRTEQGTLLCWSRGDLVLFSFRNQSLFEVQDFFELETREVFPPIIRPIPYNFPGGAADDESTSLIAPPTPPRTDPIATVNLNSGVSLQMRRFPDIEAESLFLIPNGAEMFVLGRTETPVSSDIGAPSIPDWLYVEYTDDTGVTRTGWISAEFVILTQRGRFIDLEDIEEVDEIVGGEILTEDGAVPGVSVVETQAPDEWLGVVINLNAGANLNLRDDTSAEALVLSPIPANSQITVLGRNGNGEWLRVRYEAADAAPVEGWVSANFVAVSRNGVDTDIIDLPIANDDTDTMVAE